MHWVPLDLIHALVDIAHLKEVAIINHKVSVFGSGHAMYYTDLIEEKSLPYIADIGSAGRKK